MPRNTASSHEEVIIRSSSTVVQDTHVEEKWVCDSQTSATGHWGLSASSRPIIEFLKVRLT
jgi:hypothetical protein